MYYSIGPLQFYTELALPESYRAFRCAPPDESGRQGDLFTDVITLTETSAKPDLSKAVNLAKHIHMNVWKPAKGWIFESVDRKGVLVMNDTYSAAEFYHDSDADAVSVLQPLLQAMLECSLLFHGFAILHAACVELGSKAIAFSGPSGMGKSSRAELLVRYLNAEWISGDRPAIDPVHAVACGVPWDGKEQIFVSTSAPIQALCEVRRSERTYAREMTDQQKLRFLANQLLIPLWDTALTQKTFVTLRKMIGNIPIFRLYSDITEQSVRDIYGIFYEKQIKIQKASVESSMKLNENFDIVEVAGDFMAVPTGDNMAVYGGSVVLNEISAFLLRLMKDSATEEELLEAMLNEYEIDRETAAADLKEILCTFEKLGLISK